MNPNMTGELLNATLLTMGGIWVTLLGFRKIGKRPGEDINYDIRFTAHETMFRRSGPILIACGLFLAIRAVISY